jgi:phosphoenolpyruvate-protein kinase (PTS system EI component)
MAWDSHLCGTTQYFPDTVASVILHAAIEHDIRIMFPMIAALEEIRAAVGERYT